MFHAIGGDHFRQQRARHQLRRRDAHHAFAQIGMIGNVTQGAVQVVDDLREQRVEFAPDIGQGDLARTAVNHACAQRLFQLLDQPRQGRLCDVNILRRERKITCLGQGNKGAHLT